MSKFWAGLAIWALTIAGLCYFDPYRKPPVQAVGVLPRMIGDDDYSDYEAPIVPYTEDAILMTLLPGGETWDTDMIQVPSEPNETAMFCFVVKNQHTIDCFYMDEDGQATIRKVIPTHKNVSTSK